MVIAGDPAIRSLRPEFRQPFGDGIPGIQPAAFDQRHGGGRDDRLRQRREAKHRVLAHRPIGLAIGLAGGAAIHDIAILHHQHDASHDAAFGNGAIDHAVKAQSAVVGRSLRFRGICSTRARPQQGSRRRFVQERCGVKSLVNVTHRGSSISHQDERDGLSETVQSNFFCKARGRLPQLSVEKFPRPGNAWRAMPAKTDHDKSQARGRAALSRPSRAAARALLQRGRGRAQRLRAAGDGAVSGAAAPRHQAAREDADQDLWFVRRSRARAGGALARGRGRGRGRDQPAQVDRRGAQAA